jgi:hypothetical protein
MLALLNRASRKFIIAFLSVLLLLFAPTLVSVSWHVRYGNAVVYRGKMIPVPARWVVYENQPQGLELYRMPVTIFGSKLLPTSSSFSQEGPLKIPVEEAYQSFQSGFWTYMANGGSVTGPIRLGKQENEAICMISKPKDPKSYSLIECELFQGSWYASFLGEEKDMDSFLQIVREAQ